MFDHVTETHGLLPIASHYNIIHHCLEVVILERLYYGDPGNYMNSGVSRIMNRGCWVQKHLEKFVVTPTFGHVIAILHAYKLTFFTVGVV